MIDCKFCKRVCKNANSLRNHERLCKVNPDRQSTHFEAPGFHAINRKKSNQYIKAREVGSEYIMSDETRSKLAAASKARVWSDAMRENHSAAMKRAVKNYPESYTSTNVCGRVKVEQYNGEKFHGQWEVLVAKWFDANDVKWKRQVSPFEYFWNNSTHLYFPDFYLPDIDAYVEVKGYETDRDRCKWSVVSNLIVIKQTEISLIKENRFALLAQR